MDTLIDKILEDEYRCKLFIYQFLLIGENHTIEDNILAESLEISQFKLEQYIEELSRDLEKISTTNKIKVLSPHVISGNHFSTDVYQKLRQFYFEKSLEVAVLIQVGILQNFTLLEFAQVKFISKGTAYSIVKRLNEYLANWNILLKKNQLKGSEKEIRFFLFQLFFYYYGANQPQLFKKTGVEINTIVNDIQLLFSHNFSMNQLSQLNHFLSIQDLRIVQNNFVEQNSFVHLNEGLLSRIEKWYSKRGITMSKNEFNSELGYLLSFLVLNQFIENDHVIEIFSTEIYNTFKTVALKKLPQIEQLLSGEVDRSLKLICFKWKYFAFSFATFVSEEQIIYFRQTFPKIHELVATFIKQLEVDNKGKLNQFEKMHFYYDFMFCLLQYQEIRNLEKLIHVFVDFSGGVTYNSFIKKSIVAFSYLNLVIDSKLTRETNIYISDFFNDRVSCKQIIWKNPPLDYDWKVFADQVIELKGAE